MNTSWQTTRPTVKERGQYMYKNELISDVEFSVVNSKGDTINIPAHKYALATSSPVFEAMFNGKLAETSRTISLPDCTAEGLLELLRYLYYDEVELTGSNVMEVLYLAKKYIAPSLEEKCTQYLEKELCPEDVFSVLPQALKMGEEKLQQLCWEMVDSKTHRTVTSEPFLHVTQDMLCDILERDTLNITELEIFQAVEKWAENRITEQKLEKDGKTVRRVLGDKVIELIRFPLMPKEDFWEHVLRKDILNKNELIEIFSYHCKPETFLLTPRKSCWQYDSFKRFESYSTKSWDYNPALPDSVSFSVSAPIDLTAVRLFGAEWKQYQVTLTIRRGSVPILQKEQATFTTDGVTTDGYYGFTIKLDKPVSLDPGTEYTIEALIRGPTSYHGKKGKKSIMCKAVCFNFIDRKSPNQTSATRGQFPELLFRQRP